MGKTMRVFLPALMLILSLLSLGGCGCGFDCNSDDDNSNGSAPSLTLGLSDSLPEDLKEVVLEVDSITFRRSGAEEVVDTFTFGGVEVSTFKVDLLEYPGTSQLRVIEGLELEPGTYEVSIKVIIGDTNNSFVKEANDTVKALTVSGGLLTVSGMQLAAGSQTFTVEFGLAQALQLQTNGTYLMTTNGLRIENNLTDATLSGTVDSALFTSVSPCSAKNPPTSGNRVYLYQGLQAAVDLVDVFTSASVPKPPATAVAPFAVASLKQTGATWEYAFGYLPAGDYTMAFACNTAGDDAVTFNDLVIPQQENQVYQVTLARAEKATCNLTTAATPCE